MSKPKRQDEASPGGAARQRPYRSVLREERAADTRRRIVAAARELFATCGFAGTTVAHVADRAGVAKPTVYAVFGSKGAIMRELIDYLEAEAGAEDWRTRIETEPDPRRKLEQYAAWHRELFAAGRDLLAAMLSAGGDPAVAELRQHGYRSSQRWLEAIVTALAHAGALAPGLTEQEAIDRAWILTSVEVYFRATDGRGWTDEHYQQWLAHLLVEQLLHSPIADSRNEHAP